MIPLCRSLHARLDNTCCHTIPLLASSSRRPNVLRTRRGADIRSVGAQRWIKLLVA